MGRFLIKFGLFIQRYWCKFQHFWNFFLTTISFKEINRCTNKTCVCLSKKKDK